MKLEWTEPSLLDLENIREYMRRILSIMLNDSLPESLKPLKPSNNSLS